MFAVIINELQYRQEIPPARKHTEKLSLSVCNRCRGDTMEVIVQ